MRYAALLLMAIAAAAQSPVATPFRCTAEDMDWAGLACSEEEPCPVYLEISAVEAAGNRIFLAGNIHSANTTLYSLLLTSDDDGKTWREGFERIRGATLDHIQFMDLEVGWISGGIVAPLAQDPFFLITTDGGKAWRRRPVSDESRFGSILEFWFSSRSNGSMVLDRGQSGEGGRYQLYDSPNGGETWMVKQTNERPLRLPRSASSIRPWRIRADGASKAFRLERQTASHAWTPVASFPFRIGVCKPEPVTETPPPPEMPEPKPADTKPPAPPALKRTPK